MKYLFNEDDKQWLEENEIIKIAWEAVKRRREAAIKRGKRLRLDGTVCEEGYVIYKDYEQYMKERAHRDLLKLANWDTARVRYEIRDILLLKGWMSSSHRPETRFYPPQK